MEVTSNIKERLVNEIYSTDNLDLLIAIEGIFNSTLNSRVKLSDSQKAMLNMSKNDIRNNSFVSEEEIEEYDKKWLS